MTEKVTHNLTSHEHSQLILTGITCIYSWCVCVSAVSMFFWPPPLKPDWLSLNPGSATTLDKL